MQLAFIMPNPFQRQQIGAIRESIVTLRPDQVKHMEHLLRSWRIFNRADAIELTWRAVKRTLRDMP